MVTVLDDAIEYLLSSATDPFPRYLLRKEILREAPSDAESATLATSIWHRQLAGEQWENGSWGRFHTQDTRAARKQKFVTTEGALSRARDLSLTQGDPIVRKALALMERYLTGEEAWPDRTEGKPEDFAVAFRTLIAANLSTFDPEHPLVRTKREFVARTLASALAGDTLDEKVWEAENRDGHEILLKPWTIYPIWLLQRNAFLDEALQRKFLTWIWHRQGGIYYVNNDPPAEQRPLEDRGFLPWLSGLEQLSGFSTFPEMMAMGNAAHLLHEMTRLMTADVQLPAAAPIFGHYSERWTGRARVNDLLLRIARVLMKCEVSR